MSMASLTLKPPRAAGRTIVPLLVVLFLATALLALGTGAFAIPADHILAIVIDRLIGGTQAADPRLEAVLLTIRLPRVLCGAAIGAALALAGAVIQGLFRNPLADPGLIGVSSGAAASAAAAIVLADTFMKGALAALTTWLLPLAAFMGGLGATWIVARVATREGATDTATMLLAGIAINAMAMAGVSVLIFLSTEQQLRELTFWMMGSLASVTWPALLPALPLLVLPILLLGLQARALNALLLSEADAYFLGFTIERTKRIVIVLAALATGAAVALSGIIGFVGLVAPHLARFLVGPDHRRLLPAAACLGGILLLLADIGARTLVVPAELPIGVLTSAFGGPFFLWLLLRRRPATAS